MLIEVTGIRGSLFFSSKFGVSRTWLKSSCWHIVKKDMVPWKTLSLVYFWIKCYIWISKERGSTEIVCDCNLPNVVFYAIYYLIQALLKVIVLQAFNTKGFHANIIYVFLIFQRFVLRNIWHLFIEICNLNNV